MVCSWIVGHTPPNRLPLLAWTATTKPASPNNKKSLQKCSAMSSRISSHPFSLEWASCSAHAVWKLCNQISDSMLCFSPWVKFTLVQTAIEVSGRHTSMSWKSKTPSKLSYGTPKSFKAPANAGKWSFQISNRLSYFWLSNVPQIYCGMKDITNSVCLQSKNVHEIDKSARICKSSKHNHKTNICWKILPPSFSTTKYWFTSQSGL